MQDGLYVALSSQIALERRLNTIADNVANASTVGFRATGVKFEDIVSGLGQKSVSFVSTGDTYLSTASGGLRETGNPFDFAIKGDAWFGIETPAGTVMTRDGRFTLQENGALVTVEGYPVLDAGGAPIQLDPREGPPEASADGMLRQNGQAVGALGLYNSTRALISPATPIRASFRMASRSRLSIASMSASPRALSKNPTSTRSWK